MLNNFIYSKTKDLFLENLEAGEILDEAIVFIEDTKEIWNHGTYFGVTDLSNYFTKDEVAEIYAALENSIQPILYHELKALKVNSQLIPGQQYRIIDYVTTTSQIDTQSAGHQFDIIVTADDESTLNEVARACVHEGDTYFTEAGANLAAWQIWYCVDNDTNRFEWADTENGKGVIYRMIDEFGNDCPYDFKNIMFVRYELNAPELGVSEPSIAQLSINIQAQFGNHSLSYIWGGLEDGENRYWEDYYGDVYSTQTENKKAFYTFSTVIGTVVTDHSLLQGYCCYNTMKEYIYSKKQHLNNNIFLNTSKTDSCYSNSFGNDCCFNSFGNDCCFNSFGNGFAYNSFENGCDYNSLGSSCNNNSFGNNNFTNSFGNTCRSNSFGNRCYLNSFGYECSYNSFGNNCQLNSFGNHYFSNSFGNNCHLNSFRVSANDTSALKNYVKYNHFDDGCYYNVIWNSDTTSSTIQLKNINVNRGVSGTDSSYNMINITTLNQDYELQVAKNSNGEIKIYCEADLIA